MNCKLCGKELQQKGDILSQNCGGDCLECMIREGDVSLAVVVIRNLQLLNNKCLEKLEAENRND